MDYRQILDLLIKKDKKGYEALYLLYADKFFGYAVNKWNFSEDDAMNVVYQTLETLVLKVANYEFESQAHFDNFVYKVFTNFLRQQFRYNRKKEQQISFISLSEIELGEDDAELGQVELKQVENSFSADLFTEYYQTENHENPKLLALQNALEKLEKSDKEILLLKAQNFTYDEIAEMLHIENKQLKVKHHRAKKKTSQHTTTTIKINSNEQEKKYRSN